jgi:hypothetical protein
VSSPSEFDSFRRAILAEGWLPPADAAQLRTEAKRDYDDRRRYQRRLIAAYEQLQALKAESAIMSNALFESVRLQSHYATLLNAHDGGARKTFTYAEWLERLAQRQRTVAHNGAQANQGGG